VVDRVAVPTPAERQAFLYLALVTAVGTAVRAWEGRVTPAGGTEARALAAQLAAVDSALARRAGLAARAGGASASVPRTSRVASGPPRPSSPPMGAASGPVDVDVADSASLERLPGIGPALAARIVADRAARGPFGSAEAWQRVRGIGPALARRLAAHVTFSGVPRPGEGARVPPTRRRSP
jgi:competence protein ComEA